MLHKLLLLQLTNFISILFYCLSNFFYYYLHATLLLRSLSSIPKSIYIIHTVQYIYYIYIICDSQHTKINQNLKISSARLCSTMILMLNVINLNYSLSISHTRIIHCDFFKCLIQLLYFLILYINIIFFSSIFNT